MSIVESVRKELKIGFEFILIEVRARIYALLNLLELLLHVDSRLLVAFGRVLQISERRLKLDGIIPITQKAGGNSWMKRNAPKAIVRKLCREVVFSW